MTKNFLRIIDTVQFSLLNPDLVKIKDNYEGAFKPQDPSQHTHYTGMGTVPTADNNLPTQGLLIRVAATHAGIITRNNGFYLPDKMKAGATTFLQDYPKPILLHHDDDKDPIGRVAEASYIDTSGMIADKYNGLVIKNKKGKEIGTITDALIKDFVGNKMPFGQQVDIVRSLLMDSVLSDQSYEGLGHIQLVANITDHEAIQKLLDGRYLTGSTGASTDAAICSVCRTDWTEDGRCEHTPGSTYDGAKCFIIAGALKYDEFSFVNKPADRHAKVLELHYNGIQDSVNVAEESYDRLYEVNLEFPQYSDNLKEDKMAKDNAKTDTPPTEDPKTEDIQDSANTTEETTEDSIQVEDNTTTEETVTDSTEESTDNTTVGDATTTEEETPDEESIEDFLVRVLDSEELSIEDEEKLYEAMWNIIKDSLDEELLEDAKLSTEKRNKLPKSTFCGPGRSFPVPDCAHVTAARRLIGRAKVSDATKSKILACVNRKAKAMGCSSDMTDAVQDNTDNTQDNMNHNRMLRMVLTTLEEDSYYSDDPVLDDDEKKMLQGIVKRMASLVGKDAFVQTLQEEGFAHDEQALLDEVAKHEETIGDLRDRIDASQKEYHLLFEDMEAMQSALIDTKSEIRKEKETRLSMLKVLSDKDNTESDWSTLNDSSIDSELSRLSEEVDMIKIVDKLGDGMSRVPTDSVENPIDSIQTDSVQKSAVDTNTLLKIEERFWHIRLRDGEIAAEAFLSDCKRKGLLPQGDE